MTRREQLEAKLDRLSAEHEEVSKNITNARQQAKASRLARQIAETADKLSPRMMNPPSLTIGWHLCGMLRMELRLDGNGVQATLTNAQGVRGRTRNYTPEEIATRLLGVRPEHLTTKEIK